jgi:hypothetical protein
MENRHSQNIIRVRNHFPHDKSRKTGHFSAMSHSVKAAFACLLATLLALPACAQDKKETPKPAAVTTADKKPEWKNLFDGKTLNGWKKSDFGGGGEVHFESSYKNFTNLMVIDMGEALSGVTWTNDVPRTGYEIEVEAMRINGSDFFCGLTFPVEKEHATWVLGGWGGAVVGISSIDGNDASENETTKFMAFEKNKWFNIRLRVTKEKIEGWINDEKLVNQELAEHKISMRPGEIELAVPLSISTYQSSTAIRSIKLRKL